MKNKTFIFVFAFAIFLLGIGGVFAGSFVLSNPLVTQGISSGYATTDNFYNSQCQSGQDFILQVSPEGCTPTVVRSDLLESQDIPVFCPITAIKVNPLININSVQSISFLGSYPAGVKSIGFQQKYAALGGINQLVDNPVSTIGYATIVLSKNQEQNLQNCQKSLGGLAGEVCWIEGNLTARLNYDLNGGFGIRTHSYYLPVLSNSEFSSRMGQYEFFNNMGYVRADSVTSDSATIGIYSGLLNNPTGNNDNSKRLLQRYTLKVGQSSPELMLPNVGCLSSVNFKLNSITYADTTAQISVNSETYELRQGEKFLNDKCYVSNIYSSQNDGINQQVKIHCSTDNGNNSDFSLYIEPRISFKIRGSIKNFSMGDKLFDVKDGNKYTEAVYLGYVTNAGTFSKPNLRAYLINLGNKDSSKPMKDKLSSDELYLAAQASKADSPSGLATMLKGINSVISSWVGVSSINNFITVNQGKTVAAGGDNIELVGFSDGVNVDIPQSVRSNYTNALENYTTVFDNYRNEKYPSGDLITLGEQALAKKIELANSLGQKQDVVAFCNNMKQYYPNSNLVSKTCSGSNYANGGVSNNIVLIDGKYYQIDFNGVMQPTTSEYSATFSVRDKDGKILAPVTLGKNGANYLDTTTGEYFTLSNLGEDSATIELHVKQPSVSQNVQQFFLGTTSKTIKVGSSTSASTYSITLQSIHHERVANVIVNPSIRNDNSLANFSFKVGIEKRAIQLSPEKAKARAVTVNNTVHTLEGLSNTLGGVVNTMQTACMITATTLTLKNLVLKSGTDSAARTEVMKQWKSTCEKEIADRKFSNLDYCYYNHTNEIDKQVAQLSNALKGTNDAVAKVQSELGKTPGINEQTQKFAETVSSNLPSGTNETSVKSILSNEAAMKNGVFTFEELKNLYTYSNLVKNKTTNTAENQAKFNSLLDSIQVNYDNQNKAKKEELTYGMPVQNVLDKNSKSINYAGSTVGTFLESSLGKLGNAKTTLNVKGITDSTPAMVALSGNINYLLILEKTGDNTYNILSNSTGAFYVYKISSSGSIDKVKESDAKSIGFQNWIIAPTQNVNSANHAIVGAKIQYYETGIYKGLPAIVPFDVQNGYYAFMPQSASASGTLNSYDDSGRLNFFELCKVGSTGVVSTSTDKCSYQMLSSGNYGSVPGVSSSTQAKGIVDSAVKAIAAVSKAHSAGIKSVTVNGQKIDVGAPMSEGTGISCAEVMSPKDCQVMFNVCDPVICPNDRCNFGGEYQVNNVIQSGIIGSIALCLPNAKEGIKVPVCLTGVKAGIDGLTSTLKSYRDCLVTNAETGQTVGICDEMNSIYLCEFLWKEVTPIAKLTFSKALVAIKGGGTRGGGEYLSIKSAFKNAKDSMNYFVGRYASSSFKFLKANDQGQTGANICSNFISTAYPSGQGIFSSLGVTQSPPQYTANFDEIPYTTNTNPPTSQYNVYYNIYSGKNQGAYYKVYLKSSGTSYYQDSSVGRLVASGYIPVDNYASQKKEILAPSGYDKLCVQVNDQEECGFKKVTSSFAQNYLTDQYLKSQATSNDIKTAQECVSGSVSAYTLLNLNLESAATNTLNPSISKYGIIRTCSSDNPGIGTDTNIGTSNQRWVSVGQCGDNTTMRCWLDTDSVKNAVKFNTTATQILNKTNKTTDINSYLKEGGYLDNSFSQIVSSVKDKNAFEQIKLLNDTLISKLFYSNNKAYVYLLRANAWYSLAVKAYSDYLDSKTSVGTAPGQPIKYVPITPSEIFGSSDYVSPIFYVGSGESKSYLSSSNLYYKYFNGEWHWSYNPTNDGNGGLSFSWRKITDFSELNGYNNNAYGNEISFIKKFTSKTTYFEGLNNLYKTYGSTFYIFASYDTKNLKNLDGAPSVTLSKNEFKVIVKMVSFTMFYPEVDFKFSQVGNWSFGEHIINGANFWLDMSSLETKQTSLVQTVIAKIRPSRVTSSKNSNIPKNVLDKMPPEINPLLKDLANINSLSTMVPSDKFVEGAALIFANETSWNEIGKLHATGDFTKQNVLDFLTSLEVNYTNSKGMEKEYYLNVTKLFVKDLISKGMLSGSVADYIVGGVPDFTKTKNNMKFSFEGTYTNCNPYLPYIQSAATKYGIDPNLLLAIIYQESSCKPSASSSSSYGIMQINTGVWAGKYGLSSDVSTAKTQLMDASTNINIGAQILKGYYDQYGSTGVNFHGCNVNTTYSGWKAAVRAYNGLGCNKNYPSQDLYVEKVFDLYSQFTYLDLFSSSSSTNQPQQTTPPESDLSSQNNYCTTISPDISYTTSNNPQTRIMKVVNSKLDQTVTANSCWDSVYSLYKLAGLDVNCVYSDSSGRSYDITYTSNSKDYTKTAKIGTSPYIAASSPKTECNLNKVSGENLPDNKKYSDLEPGDIMSVVWQDTVHNVIFLNWNASAPQDGTYVANVFSWYCTGWNYDTHSCDGVQKYGKINIDMSSGKFPVYQYWKPVIASS